MTGWTLDRAVWALAVCVGLMVVMLPAGEVFAHGGDDHTSMQFNHNHVRYDSDGTGLSVVSSPSTLDLLQGGGGLTFYVADRPFVLYDNSSGDLEEWGAIIQSIVGMDLHGAFGFGPADIGLHVPVAPVIVWGSDPSGGDFPVQAEDEGAFGDIVLVPKLRIVDPAKKTFGLGVQIPVSFPTGHEDRYFGDAGVTLSVDLLAELRLKRFRVLANFTPLHLRPELSYGEFARQVGMAWKAGVSVNPMRSVSIRSEVWGTVSYMGASNQATAEWSASIGLSPSEGVSLELGAGSGIVGLGAPRLRAFAGVRVTSPSKKDSDGDQVLDGKDECPEDPEDLDSFEDEDGCPDLDNDGDDILDTNDACPDAAEDAPGEGADGCPEVTKSEALTDSPAAEEAAEEAGEEAAGAEEAAEETGEAAEGATDGEGAGEATEGAGEATEEAEESAEEPDAGAGGAEAETEESSEPPPAEEAGEAGASDEAAPPSEELQAPEESKE